MIGGAVFWITWSSGGGGEQPGAPPTDRSFSPGELALYDGKDGEDCLVAVDGDVYLVEGFALWQMGEHLPSGGRARCGSDLSEAIDESPHGRSKLRLLEKVGTLG